MTSPMAEFTHDGIRLLGSSLAGEASYVIAPELNVAFDIGRAPREIIGIDHVFLTHGHMDHSAGIAYYLSQRMFIDNAPGNVYLPNGLVEPVRTLLRTWAEIDGREPRGILHLAEHGQDIKLRRDLIVRPFTVNHPCRRRGQSTVMSLGYSAIEVRHKLKDEYHGLTDTQIVQLKGKGIEVTRRVEIPLVTYCGDTAAGDFLDLDHVRESKILLLECTFIEPEHLDRARAGSHIHITDLPAILPRLNNERIVLTHLSRRTALSRARRILSRELSKSDRERVSLLMEHCHRGQSNRKPISGDSAAGKSR